MTRYQERAAAEGVDPLGYYMAPWSYAQLQVVRQAVEGTKGLDDTKLGDYMRANTFKTVVGDVKFGRRANGRNRACCKSSSRTSRPMTSLSSRTSRPKSWWRLSNTCRAS